MIAMLAASQGLSPDDPSFWMPLAFMALLFLVIAAGMVLDGFDLGVGILLQLAPEHERGRMMSLLSPWRDANEFWLLLGMGLFAAAFPFAWGAVLGKLYGPLTCMVLGVVLRSVAFEFRIRARNEMKPRWIFAFWAGSLITAFGQGMMLGRIATGYQSDAGYVGSRCSWACARWPPTSCWARPGWSCGWTATCNGAPPTGPATASAGRRWAWCRSR